MSNASFHLDWIQALVDHRSGPATAFFQVFSALGEIEGYVIVVCFLYVAVDKRLAVRLGVLALVAMSLNHVLKTWIANPRPFVAEGSHLDKWEVSTSNAEELAAEYSTPSGHAMTGGSFYTYLGRSVRARWVQIVAGAMLLLTGLCRPYLGVHYLEDILLGWALGIPLALVAFKFSDRISHAWNRRSLAAQVAILLAMSGGLWLVTRPFYAANPHGTPLAFLSYTGLLTGIVLATPLEAKWVRFDPRSASPLCKGVRFAIGVAAVLGTLALLDAAFDRVANEASALGNALRFLRYAVAGGVGLLAAPWAFVKLGLADRSEEPASPAAPNGLQPGR